MDHLMQWPESSGPDQDYVPYIARTDYAGVPFLVYLNPYTKLDNFQECFRLTVEEMSCIFQTCFFFSLLQEILGKQYSHSHYVRSSTSSSRDHVQVVTTALLEEHLRTWVETTRSEEDNVRQEVKNHLRRCYDRLFPIFCYSANRISQRVRVGIAALFASTQQAFMDAFQEPYWHVPTMKIPWPEVDDARYMAQHGSWCPFEARKAWRSFDYVSTVMLLRSMQRRKVDERHLNCTDLKCNMAYISKENFYCPHATDECSCEEALLMDTARLVEMLNNGETPLLRLTVTQTSDYLMIDLVAADPATSYIAVSHVWSDGLGNPIANAIRMCQLRALANKAFELSIFLKEQKIEDEKLEVHIWLDTVCVPIEPLATRLQALSQMVQYYRDAKCVLVLDSEIQAHEYYPEHLILAGMVIFSSRWLWRLWTLQESLMASRLYFAFANTFVDRTIFLDSEEKRQQLRTASYGARIIMTDFWRLAMALSVRPGQRSIGRDYSLIDLHESVKNRLVSVASDEPLCLANVYGFELAVPEAAEGCRMALFWKVMCGRGAFDQNVIFNPFPRLQQIGWRWAPATLLLHQLQPKLHDNLYFDKLLDSPKPEIKEDGIQVALPGLKCRVNDPESTCKRALEAHDHANMAVYFFYAAIAKEWFWFGCDVQCSENFVLSETATTCALVLETLPLVGLRARRAVLASTSDERQPQPVETMMVGSYQKCQPA